MDFGALGAALFQQIKDPRRQLVYLRQNCGACLLEHLQSDHLGYFLGYIGVANSAFRGNKIFPRDGKIIDGAVKPAFRRSQQAA